MSNRLLTKEEVTQGWLSILGGKLIELVEEETGAKGVSIHTRLDSIVEDSLEFLDLICTLETAFGFKIPDKRYIEVQTVGDLCSFAADHVSA